MSTGAFQSMDGYHVKEVEKVSPEYLKYLLFYGVSFFLLALSVISLMWKLFFPKQYIVVSEKGILFPSSLLRPKKKFVEYKYIHSIKTRRKPHITYLIIETFESDLTVVDGVFESSDHFYKFIDLINMYKSKYNKTLERNS